MFLKLMYITNSPSVALIAEKYGVDRIWVDLETKDKEERQSGRDTVKSRHTIEDIKKISPVLTTSGLLVRINHWNINSEDEIDAVIDAGADLIMLPYWKTVEEVKSFIRAVSGRCKTVLLLETKEAAGCLDEVLELSGIDEIHIGLNDLHLSYGFDFLFQPLVNGMVEQLCRKITKKNIPYGFGGIARIGCGDVPAEMIIMEHYRLGSTRAILSRAFCDTSKVEDIAEIEKVFRENMSKLHEYENYVQKASLDEFEENRARIKEAVNKVAGRLKNAS